MNCITIMKHSMLTHKALYEKSDCKTDFIYHKTKYKENPSKDIRGDIYKIFCYRWKYSPTKSMQHKKEIFTGEHNAFGSHYNNKRSKHPYELFCHYLFNLSIISFFSNVF